MKTLRGCAVLAMVLVMAMMVVRPVAAQEVGDPGLVPKPIVDVLALMAKGLATGFVLAFLFEKPGWFKHLQGETKWWIVFAVSLFLPVVAQLLIDVVPVDVWSTLEPYWQALAWGFLSWAASQAVFKTWIKPAPVPLEEIGFETQITFGDEDDG